MSSWGQNLRCSGYRLQASTAHQRWLHNHSPYQYLFSSVCLILAQLSEKAMAPHSSTLAWKIPWMEEPGRLQSMESLRVGHDWATSLSLFTFMRWRRKWQPIDGSPPGSAILGILQAGTLAWVAISFSNACKWKVKVKSLSRVWLLATPWTAAYQAPPSMGFSRQEYWVGCHCLLDYFI